jgi:hypothetical protein
MMTLVKVDVAKLREMYPNPTAKPVRPPRDDSNIYTVDEALIQLRGHKVYGTLPLFASVLAGYNPKLRRINNDGQSMHYVYAVEIMTANDNSDFDTAWALLEEAINFPPTVLGPDVRPHPFDQDVLEATAEMMVHQVMFDIGAKEEERAQILSDLVAAMEDTTDFEGYRLAKRLEEYFDYKPDAQLVGTLGGADARNHVAHSQVVAKWVEHNKITPKFQINARVLAKIDDDFDSCGDQLGTIIKISAQQAQYWVLVDVPAGSDDRTDNYRGVYVVNYENVKELQHGVEPSAVPRTVVEEQSNAAT